MLPGSSEGERKGKNPLWLFESASGTQKCTTFTHKDVALIDLTILVGTNAQ